MCEKYLTLPQEREGQESLFVTVIKTSDDLDKWLVEHTRRLEAMPEDNASEVQAKAEAYQRVSESTQYRKQKQVADLWTAAFFWNIEEPIGKFVETVAPTIGQLRRLQSGSQTQSGLLEQAEKISSLEGFFHWPLEFADVTAQNGFDCILGNPPWEMLQLEEQEFFASIVPEISRLPGEQRKRAINELHETNPNLYQIFENAKHLADARNKFFREGKRFPFTATGKMNSYALFTEHVRDLIASFGHAGIIVPTGIATDDTTKDFFGDLVKKQQIVSLYDFQNREALFPGVHRSYKFCLLTMSQMPVTEAFFVFFATQGKHLHDPQRLFRLAPNEIATINPNTKTMPVFRTRADSDLALKIYKHVPILENEITGENPWKVSFKQGFFNMTSDSHLFSENNLPGYLKLYEAKMIWQFDHRYSEFRNDNSADISEVQKVVADYLVTPRYYIAKNQIQYKDKYFVIQRGLADMNNEKRMISSVIPFAGVGNSAYIYLFEQSSPFLKAIFCGIINSLVCDYIIRLKAQNPNLNQFILKQLPIIPPNRFSQETMFIMIPRLFELIYTAWDLQGFADDLWFRSSSTLREKLIIQWEENSSFTKGKYQGDKRHDWGEFTPESFPYPPFTWSDERRAILRAELDVYYSKLYGLNRDELRYILDPQDVYGPDFPGETFRVLKDKEIRQFGEYRTRRLVLEAWDRLEGVEVGNPDGHSAQSAAVSQKQETILVPQPKSESRPAAVQTQRPATAKPNSPVTPPAKVASSSKVIKEIDPPVDPPVDQPTLSDFGLYKCEVCGKMVMGFEKANHEQEKHGGKSVDWKKMR